MTITVEIKGSTETLLAIHELTAAIREHAQALSIRVSRSGLEITRRPTEAPVKSSVPTVEPEPVASVQPSVAPIPAPEPPSAVPESAAAPVPPRPTGDWLTRERRAELERRIKAGEYPSLYCPPLRAMPGPAMPVNRKVQARAIALKIRWTPPPKPPTPRPDLGPDRMAIAMTPPRVRGRPPSPAEPDGDFEPIEADYEKVAAWAAAHGASFASWDDLPRVNAKRERLKVPTFKRKLTGRPMQQGSAG